MTRVAIVQDYVPVYRAPFFERLRDLAHEQDMEIVVSAGSPSGAQATRRDSATVEGLRTITQHERRVLGCRVTARDIGPGIQDSDLVVLEQARRNVDAYRLLARRHRPRPIALWGHGRDYTQRPGMVARTAYNWLTRRADWFFAYTEGGKEAVGALGFPEDRITVVQNSIDTTGLTRAIGQITMSALTEYAQACDLHGKTALFIGGLDGSKRLPFLLDAAQRVAQEDPEFRLLIAGAGVDISVIVNSLPRAPWLRYLGPVSGHEKALALASSQVIAMPGRVGLVAVDSFAAGTPIVTTSWPWHAPEFEYLRDGLNAVVSNDSAEAYAIELSAVLNDSPRLARLCDGAMYERERYTIDEMARRYLDGLQRWRNAPWRT